MKKEKFYHGTNRVFEKHDEKKSRTSLNDKYQGDWICYTKSQDVAWKYADAARNQCFDRDLFIEDMQKYFKEKGVEGLYLFNLSLLAMEKGSSEAIDEMVESYAVDKKITIDDAYPEFFSMLSKFNDEYGLEINDWFDLLEYVEGSKVYDDIKENDVQDLMNVFNSTVKEIDCYAIEMHKRLKFSKSKIEPKIICSEISYENPLYTDDRDEAKKARENGYDVVFYSGEGCVDGETEVLISDPKQVNVLSIIVRHEKREYEDDGYYSEFSYEEILVDKKREQNECPQCLDNNLPEEPKRRKNK